MSAQINLATLRRILSSPARQSFLTDDKWEAQRLLFLENPETAEYLEAEILDNDTQVHDNPDPLDELLSMAGGDDVSADEPEETFGQRMARLRAAKKAGKSTTTKATKAEPAQKPKSYSYVAQSHKSKTAGNVCGGKVKSPTVHTIGIAQVDDSGNVCNRIMLGSVQARLIVELARNPDQLAALDKLAAKLK